MQHLACVKNQHATVRVRFEKHAHAHFVHATKLKSEEGQQCVNYISEARLDTISLNTYSHIKEKHWSEGHRIATLA